jgi:hypothetical protein
VLDESAKRRISVSKFAQGALVISTRDIRSARSDRGDRADARARRGDGARAAEAARVEPDGDARRHDARGPSPQDEGRLPRRHDRRLHAARVVGRLLLAGRRHLALLLVGGRRRGRQREAHAARGLRARAHAPLHRPPLDARHEDEGRVERLLAGGGVRGVRGGAGARVRPLRRVVRRETVRSIDEPAAVARAEKPSRSTS